MNKIWAVRGATTIDQDSSAEVITATESLLQEIFLRNMIHPEDIVSLIFTVTPDITSEFPAVAARNLGLNTVPLLCAQELAKPGALSHCIRVLIHFYTELDKDLLQPVYLKEAVKLRPDLISYT